jgi:hypothetical protein
MLATIPALCRLLIHVFLLCYSLLHDLLQFFLSRKSVYAQNTIKTSIIKGALEAMAERTQRAFEGEDNGQLYDNYGSL